MSSDLFAHAVEGVCGASEFPRSLFGKRGTFFGRGPEGFRRTAESVDRVRHALQKIDERNEQEERFEKDEEALRPDHQTIVRLDGKEDRKPRAVRERDGHLHGRGVKRKKRLFAAYEHVGGFAARRQRFLEGPE